MALNRVNLPQQLVGTWLLCGSQPILASDTGEAGIQVNANGTWVLLGRTLSGGLVDLSGSEDTGSWSVIAPPTLAGPWAPEVVFLPRATSAPGRTTTPLLTAGTPQRVRFLYSGLTADYERTTTPVRSGGSAQ
jgi:hypothetical protein